MSSWQPSNWTLAGAGSAALLLYPNLLGFSLNVADRLMGMCMRRKPTPKAVYAVPTTKPRPGEGPIMRNTDSKDVLLSTPFEGYNTMWEIWCRSVERNGDRPCLGHRPLDRIETLSKIVDGKEKKWQIPHYRPAEWLTYAEVHERVLAFAAGLRALGVQKDEVIAIYEETRTEWLIAALACLSQSIPFATVYANLGEEALLFALAQCEVRLVVCGGGSVATLQKLGCRSLRTAVFVDSCPAAHQTGPLQTVAFESVLQRGAAAPAAPVPPRADQLAMIMFTSGTSEAPKGVMISHANVTAGIAGINEGAPALKQPGAVYLGYLPLAHILEFCCEMTVMAFGGRIGFGTPRTLTAAGARPHGDLAEFRPTLMAGVPRVWDTIKKEALHKVNTSPAPVRWLFHTAYRYKLAATRAGRETPLWNALVFRRFREQLGGRAVQLASGGAPLSGETQDFMRVCFNLSCAQGYGLTETASSGCLQQVSDLSVGRVGAPMRCCELKLVDCPDLGYVSAVPAGQLPAGEVWIRGPNVTMGYFRNEALTREAFIDGWFATGDIGRWHPDGTLQIVDRKKNLVKLSFGEYVALEKLEGVYMNSAFVQPNGVCAYGDSLQDFVVALVLPHKAHLTEWARKNGVPEADDFPALCRTQAARRAVLASFDAEGKKHNLKSFEMCRNVLLLTDEWTPENGCLTAAMKLKRQVLKERYKSELAALYAELKKAN